MRFRLVINGETHEVAAVRGRVVVDGRVVNGEAFPEGSAVRVRVGRRRLRVLLTRWGAVVGDAAYRLEVRELDLDDVEPSRGGAYGTARGRVHVRPPMPGRVVRIEVREGERVDRHRPLLVLEAMKMQNEVPAPVAGTVREIRVREGETVRASDVLVVLDSG